MRSKADTTDPDAGTWSPGPFGLVFQRTMLRVSRRLEHAPGALCPDLSELAVESILDGHRAALRLSAANPFARGFAAADADLAGDLLRLDGAPGEHEICPAVRPDYSRLPGRTLRWTLPEPPAPALRRGQIRSGTMSIAPHGHSAAQMPQPLQ